VEILDEWRHWRSVDTGGVETLEEWRHLMEGVEHPFLVWTKLKNLEYLSTAKRLNSRQARFRLCYSPGSTSPFPIGQDPRMLNLTPSLACTVSLPHPLTPRPSSLPHALQLLWAEVLRPLSTRHNVPSLPGYPVVRP
jgi:hypothetical protein